MALHDAAQLPAVVAVVHAGIIYCCGAPLPGLRILLGSG
jgi:hypothetical protein